MHETRWRWRTRAFGFETVFVGALVLSSLSGVFLGEVDHIWLFFVPLLVAPAGAAIAARADGFDWGSVRLPLILGLVQALLMQVLLYTFW